MNSGLEDPRSEGRFGQEALYKGPQKGFFGNARRSDIRSASGLRPWLRDEGLHSRNSDLPDEVCVVGVTTKAEGSSLGFRV